MLRTGISRRRSMAMAQLNLPPRGIDADAPRATLRRSRRNRMLAGVAGGVAEHLGLDPFVVRLAFLVLAFAAGFGVVVYLLLWVLAPSEPVDAAVPAAKRHIPRLAARELLGGGLIVAGVLIILWFSGLWFGDGLAWPVTLAAIGFPGPWGPGAPQRGRRTRARW